MGKTILLDYPGMRSIVSLLLTVILVASFELSAAFEKAVRRQRTLSEKNGRRNHDPLATWRPPMPLQWNDPQYLRTLQDAEESSGKCIASDRVNFESDDFKMLVFGSDTFGATCNCSESSNRDEVFAEITMLSPADGIASYVDQVNELIGSMYSMSEYQCINTCETCLNDVCGVLETKYLSSTTNKVGNLTFDEIFSDLVDVLSSFANATFVFSNCASFTGNENGKICFNIEFDTVPIPFADTPCTIEYNGEACNSCVIPNADFVLGGNCFTADCTNIDPSAMPNSCNDTGFVGPFVFLELLETENVTNSTFTVGSCDMATSPIAPTDSGSTPAPISTPTEAPITAPTTESPVEPVAPPVPTLDTTASPKSAPVVAPVRAPVTAPSPSLPSPIATSGSFGPYVIVGNVCIFLCGMVVGAL